MPNNYARIVRCAHFTCACACARDCEIESELRALIQMLFQYPTYNYTNTIKIKCIYFICHIHNYTEYNSLHLTHPSAHTLGAVGSRLCGVRGAVGGSGPCSRVSPQSWILPARAGIRTHNLGLPRVSRLPHNKKVFFRATPSPPSIISAISGLWPYIWTIL